jgi:Fe-S-cluster-containing dehydrogenase component
LIQKNCMCRYMTRGIKEPCCINFGVMSEIIDKLPRFIPEKEKYHLGRAEAVARFTEFNRRGYIGTIWYGPYPYINNLCSCENPECAGIRPRRDFGIMSIYKAEYVIGLLQDACSGCMRCVRVCPFGALSFDKASGKAAMNQAACWGCGVCRHACERGALFLQPREQVAGERGRY